MSAEPVRPGTRRAAIAAFGIGAAVDVAYVLLVLGRGAELGPREMFFAALLGVMAAFAIAGAAMGTLDERLGQVLLYGATTGYLLAGLLGLASIGLFLIVAGLLAFIGAGPRRVPVGVVAAVVAMSASALIIGIELT